MYAQYKPLRTIFQPVRKGSKNRQLLGVRKFYGFPQIGALPLDPILPIGFGGVLTICGRPKKSRTRKVADF